MKAVTLGRPIQMEKSRCFEANTSTNATFAQSSLPEDFNLLITMSVLTFGSEDGGFYPKTQGRAETSRERCLEMAQGFCCSSCWSLPMSPEPLGQGGSAWMDPAHGTQPLLCSALKRKAPYLDCPSMIFPMHVLP